jgi:N-acetylmuramoyl-L-alanine amidase
MEGFMSSGSRPRYGVPRRRAAFLAAGVLGLLSWCVLPASATTITGIRFSSSSERTRVVLDLDRQAGYTHRTLPNPPRIVVEFPQGAFATGVEPRPIGDGFVKRVRTNAMRNGKIQAVLDLAQPLDYSIFSLKTPDRVVIDVQHGGGPAPTAKSPRPERASGENRKATEGSGTGSRASATPTKTPRTRTEEPAPKEKTPPPVRLSPPSRDSWIVAIDAGHGGEDHGARHHRTSEKDITLELALELKRELEKRPGLKPILVRKGDYFIPLRRRWTLAEKQGAHLFVSLHCNASPDRKAEGTEVFFLSLKGATDEAARELAQRENAVDAKMGVEVSETELDEIIFDMMQTDVLTKSEILAETCLEHLFELGTVYGRGVKQAGFAVLKSPRMPSVLVEAAFISSRDEVELLRDSGWRRRFGEHLADGIESYVHSVDTAEKVSLPSR